MAKIYIFITSYFIGCAPTAFLLVKFFKNKDIRIIGSGNIGALNTFETTNSKPLAIFTLLSDMLKGILALYISTRIFGINDINILLSSLSVVIGHNYNIFLKFKGGRGLATSAAVIAIINPQLLIYWSLSWIISKIIFKEIHTANVISSIISPIFVLFSFNVFFDSLFYISQMYYIILSFLISIIIISAHSR